MTKRLAMPGVSVAEFRRAGVPRALAQALAQECATVDQLAATGRLSQAAGLRHIRRLAARLAELQRRRRA